MEETTSQTTLTGSPTPTVRPGICPKCGKEIDHLTFVQDRMVVGEYREGIHYEMDSSPVNPEDDPFYECPKCGELLFRDSRRADAFLRPNRRPKEDK